MTIRSCSHFLLALALLTSLACRPQQSGSEEAYAVYSAYLESQMLHNVHDYGAGGGTVVIQQTTSTLPLEADLARVAKNLKGAQSSTLANFREVVSETGLLERKFSLPISYVVASPTDIASGKVESDYGFLALSRVGLNRDGTQALFHIDHFCPLCGGSGYVLMKKNILGTWKIESQFFTVVT